MAFGSPLFPLPPVFNGIEIDMLSLGDADSIIVTRHVNSQVRRILIDGGSGTSAPVILDLLLKRGWTEFSAAICSHLHNDHAAGLIKLVQDPRLHFHMGFMNDVRNHIAPDALRRAANADEGVEEVWETTKELGAAFAGRKIPFYEPFAGGYIPDWPEFRALGPSVDFYKKALAESTKVDLPIPVPFPAAYSSLGSILGGVTPPTPTFGLAGPAPTRVASPDFAAFLSGALSNSSIHENPRTQAFNNTSTILGIVYNGHRLMFTGDAGSDALNAVPAEWKNLEWIQIPHHGSEHNLSQKNIERFCPRFSYVSARGDSSHPSRAIVNCLLRVRPDAQVYSTHSLKPGHLWYRNGVVPSRADYGPALPLKATGNQKPFDWTQALLGNSR